jgi:DNA mismatch endonuclease (patch repair protein)
MRYEFRGKGWGRALNINGYRKRKTIAPNSDNEWLRPGPLTLPRSLRRLRDNALHKAVEMGILVPATMADRVTREKRSWIMSRVRRADTKPEVVVRSTLHRMGYRFRLHDPRLPGRPDIVLRRHNAVIFVNGCFWHRHRACKKMTTPKVRKRFWVEKFKRNMERDRKNYRLLRRQGWRILVLWECQVDDIPTLGRRILAFLREQ